MLYVEDDDRRRGSKGGLVHDAQLLTQLMKCKCHAGVYPHEDISSTPIALQMHLIMAHSRKVRCNLTYFYSLIKLASSAEVEVR